MEWTRNCINMWEGNGLREPLTIRVPLGEPLVIHVVKKIKVHNCIKYVGGEWS